MAARLEADTSFEAERNRARRTEEPFVLVSIEAHLGWLQAALAELEEQIEQRLATNPVWCATAGLLACVPGVGRSPSAP